MNSMIKSNLIKRSVQNATPMVTSSIRNFGIIQEYNERKKQKAYQQPPLYRTTNLLGDLIQTIQLRRSSRHQNQGRQLVRRKQSVERGQRRLRNQKSPAVHDARVHPLLVRDWAEDYSPGRVQLNDHQ